MEPMLDFGEWTKSTLTSTASLCTPTSLSMPLHHCTLVTTTMA